MEKPSLLGIFYQPAVEFRKLREQPVFVTALILVLVLSTIITTCTGILLIHSPTYMESIAKEYPSLTPEDLENVKENLPITSGIFGILNTILIILVYAFLTWIFALLFQKQTSFKKMFALCAYASIALPFLWLSELLLILAGVSQQIPHLSLGNILPVTGTMKSILNSFELFTIWGHVLLAIGLREAVDLSPAKAWTTAGMIFLLVKLPFLFF